MNQPGKIFKALVENQKPLQVFGTLNAYSALLAERAGAKAIYLSGGGVAAGSLGMPDLGINTLEDVLIDVRRITSVSKLPLLVDIDTGWGGSLNIARSIKEVIRAGAAAVHIEDQLSPKRCGHRPEKQIVPTEEMQARIKAAVDARTCESFVVMARTDAMGYQSRESVLERCQKMIESGADMVFPEAIKSLEDYQFFAQHLSVPILANITEFGKTPLFSKQELKKAGVAIILYPLTAFRTMSQTALNTYQCLIDEGTQKSLIDQMQTREELYDILNYYPMEAQLDKETIKNK